MDIMFLRFEHTDLKGVKEQRIKKKKFTALIAIDIVKNILLYGQWCNFYSNRLRINKIHKAAY